MNMFLLIDFVVYVDDDNGDIVVDDDNGDIVVEALGLWRVCGRRK